MRFQSSAATRFAGEPADRAAGLVFAAGLLLVSTFMLPTPFQQGALAFHAPAIAGERAVGAHHAVAGDRDRDPVRRAGLSDRAHGLRPADAPRDLGIARGRSARDLAQRLPDALLERGAAHVERQIEPLRRRLDEADHPRDHPLEALIAADQPGLRKAILKAAHERVRVVAELDRADALAGRRDEDRAERALADREADRGAIPAAAKLRRGHAEEIGRSGVEAPARIEAGAVDRLGDRAALRKLLAHAFGALCIAIGFRRHAGHGLEDAVEVEAAHAGGVRQRVEARHLVRLLDRTAGFCDQCCLTLGERGFVRPAALARAEARALGGGAARMEADVLASRPARRAGRPAIDAGREHRVVERAIRRAVAPQDRVPALVVA